MNQGASHLATAMLQLFGDLLGGNLGAKVRNLGIEGNEVEVLLLESTVTMKI